MRRFFISFVLATALLPAPNAPAATAGASIVHGSRAHRGEAPWMVALNIDPGTRNRSLCGGTLITHYLVLTAAHCVKGSQSWYISAGMRVFGGFHANLARAHRATWAIYDGRYGQSAEPHYAGYDFALVASGTYIPSPTIRVNNYLQLPYRHYFNVFGWGATNEASTTGDSHLRRGIVRLYLDSACGGISAGAQLCAGMTSTGTQSCHGDSGGPLTWGVGRRAVEVGVVSYGLNGQCGAGRSIYGDVAQSDWLRYWLHYYSVPGW